MEALGHVLHGDPREREAALEAAKDAHGDAIATVARPEIRLARYRRALAERGAPMAIVYSVKSLISPCDWQMMA
jgi:hypothetical protein